MTKAEASASCIAVNTGAFNLTDPAFDLGNSAILTAWSVGDKITVTFTDAVGFSHADGLFHGPTLGAIGSLQSVTVPSGGTASFTYTVVSGDLTNGILVDPENNDQVTATCVAVSTNSTTTALISSPNASVFGQPVSLTASVLGSGGTPTGSVLFKDGATTIGSGPLVAGSAAISVSSLSVGAHSLTAVYSGDASFATSTSIPVTQTVNKGATAAVVSGAPNPGLLGQPVTFTATVSATPPAAGAPTGNVMFKDGASTLGSVALVGGSATFTTSALTLGTHSITAVYSGDGNFSGSTSPALSQIIGVARAWVSAVGADTGACPRDVPCLTFSYALSVTVASGEINCLDPGGFGAATITKSISIVCDYTEGGVLTGGSNGFIIDAPAGSRVTLKGQDVECLGTGINGVEMIGVGVILHLHKSQIRNCRGGSGILIAPSSGNAKVFVADSYITDNGASTGQAGLLIRPTGGATVVASVNRVQFENNTNAVFMDGSGGGGIAHLNVKRSILGRSSNSGIALSSSGAANTAVVSTSMISFNANTGAAAAGASATLKLGSNTIANNVTGVANLGGTLQSFKNNQITDNGSDGTPMAAVPGYSGTGQ